MNKTLVAILVAGLATATASHAKESESEHGQEKATTAAPHSEQDNHDDHREENHKEHDAHKPDSEHGHDDHGDENHDEHSAHDEHNSGSEHGHEEHSEGGDHDNHGGHGGHEEATSASLNPAQMTLADIQVNPLTPRKVDYQLYAPGEDPFQRLHQLPGIAPGALRGAAPPCRPGDHVEQSQPLVTLFSETVAQAQANYRTAWPEWQRVQELGRKTVGEQRYITAKNQPRSGTGDAAGLRPFRLGLASVGRFSAICCIRGVYPACRD